MRDDDLIPPDFVILLRNLSNKFIVDLFSTESAGAISIERRSLRLNFRSVPNANLLGMVALQAHILPPVAVNSMSSFPRVNGNSSSSNS
jgi:hypothetical protein